MNFSLIQSFSFIFLLSFLPSAFAKLNDYQQFASYPYLEKSYRLQAEGNYSSAIKELQSAIKFAPNHIPFQVLLFELLIANSQTDQALDLYASIPKNSRGTLLSQIIETQISENNLYLSSKLKKLIEELPTEQRQHLYQLVASRLIAKGQYTLTYEWLSEIENLSPELLEIMMRLSDKLEKYKEIEKYFLAIPINERTSAAERLYAFSLFRIDKTKNALDFAQKNPTSQLSFDIYYQFLQSSIANGDMDATKAAFEWIEKYHQLNEKLLKQKFETALQSKDKETTFAVMSQLNESCQKRIEVALSFNWNSKAVQDLIICQNTMHEPLWLTYAATLLSIEQLEELVANKAKYSASISKILITRYVAKQQYQLAVNEIHQAKLASSYTETLAFSYEKLGQIELASEQFIKLYKSTNNDQYLDTSTFLLLKQGKNNEALSLLEKRLIYAPKNMPQNLIERLSQLYQQQPDKLNSTALISLAKVTSAQDVIAEMLRLKGDCSHAVNMLNLHDVNTVSSWTTRALCSADNAPELSLQYWKKSYNQSQNIETLRAIAYAQGSLGDSAAALESLNKLGQQNWTKKDFLYLAQLHYQQQDYKKSETYWRAAQDPTDAWLDFGIELAIKQKDYTQAQSLSTQLLKLNNQFNEQQWARQAIIYQHTGQKNKEIRAWQSATELAPDHSIYELSLAYSLIDTQPQNAYQILKNIANSESDIDLIIWEQLGYLAAQNNQQDDAIHYIKTSIEIDSQTNEYKEERLSWGLRQYYRDLSQNWHLTASFSQGTGAILGEVFYENTDTSLSSLPTNNLSSRAEYFFNTTNKKWSVYAQLSANGSDSRPLNEWSQELGVSYKIFDQYNIKTSLGAQRFVSGDWETVVRLAGGLFDQGKWRQGWRFDDSWWQRLFYFDLLFLPKSDQFLGLGRFDIGYVKALNTSSKQTVIYYGLAQYDFRKLQLGQPNNQSTYTQSSLGLGVKWNLFTSPEFYYDRVHTYSLALEWRLTASGNLTNDNSGFFLIGSYHY